MAAPRHNNLQPKESKPMFNLKKARPNLANGNENLAGSERMSPRPSLDRIVQFSLVALFIAVAFLASPPSSRAQVLYGSLVGNVTDPNGHAVPGAKVDIVNIGTGEAKRTTSDDNGGYSFTNLQVGVYRVTVSMKS